MRRMPGERLPDSATPRFPDTPLRLARFPVLAQELNTKVFLEFGDTPSQSYASRATNWHDFFPGCQPSNRPFARIYDASLGRRSCGTGCSCLVRIERWRLGCTAIRLRRDNSAREFQTNRKDLDNSPFRQTACSIRLAHLAEARGSPPERRARKSTGWSRPPNR